MKHVFGLQVFKALIENNSNWLWCCYSDLSDFFRRSLILLSTARQVRKYIFLFYWTASVSAKTVGIVIGVLVAVVVLIAIGVFVFYKYVHQKRVRARAPQQMAVAYTTAQPQQVAMYPPSAGPQQGYAPPPYNQGAGVHYPPQGRLVETVGHLIVRVQQTRSKSRSGIKDGLRARVLAFHLCGTCSILEPGAKRGLSLLLVLVLSGGSLFQLAIFPSPQETTIANPKRIFKTMDK